MDITPATAAGKQMIDGYRRGHFRIAGAEYAGSVIVFPERVVRWPVSGFGQVDAQALAAVFQAAEPVEVLLIGTGAQPQPIPRALRAAAREARIGIDAMATAPACRTFNVMLGEQRAVAAALIAL